MYLSNILDPVFLPELRERFATKRIVFCSGSFDLLHFAHVKFFEKCRTYGDILVVGVGSDEVIRSNKGLERPILGEDIRLPMVASIRFVDYCYLDPILSDKRPLATLEYSLTSLKPNTYVVNSEAFNMEYRHALTSELGIRLIIGEPWRPDLISTSRIIEKIKRLK